MAAPRGNQNARKAKIWEQALKRALARYSGSTVDAGLDKLADRLVKAAGEGDESAFATIVERIADRMDGKPAQSVEVTGNLTHELPDSELDSQLAALAEAGIVGAGAREATSH